MLFRLLSVERVRAFVGQIEWRALLPTMTFLFALLLLRHELVGEVGDYQQALATGFWRGAFFDVLVALYPALIAQLLWVPGAPKRVVWPLVAFVIWLAGFSNLVHYKYFGVRLDWWIVELHWSDFFVVQGSAAQLGLSAPVVISLLSLIAALVIAAVPRSTRRAARPSVGPWWRVRLLRLGWALALFVVCSGLWRVPRWTGTLKGSGVLADNVVRVWIKQTTSQHSYAGAGTDWFATWAEGLDEGDRTRPNRVLATYQQFEDPGPARSPGPVAIEGEPDTWPLVRDLDIPPHQTRALREELGLPVDGPINVVMLFLESVRAYEIYHPELAPQIMPGFRKVLDEHAIHFPQTYSSSFTAGQTVRGQFSTLCSMLPNMTGAATYIAHGGLRVRCLQQLFKERGYQTAWMNTHHSMYHNKRAFETAHGTERFFEREDFEARGVTETAGRWGLADEPFLVEVVALLEELAASGKPVFANVLTISVHHPYSFHEQGEIPEELAKATGGREYYRKYLSRLRYEDRALTRFFDTFFASSLASNTVVVVLADHSAPVRPHHKLEHRQLEEIRFRIPFAFVTANPRAPRAVATPVHQVDVAPMVASLIGLRGEVTWVGRDPLVAGVGSPWIYDRGNQLMFRTSERGCYPGSKKGPMRCYDVSGLDPMFAAEVPELAVDEGLVAFFADVVRANMHTIVMNLAQPPRRDALRD